MTERSSTPGPSAWPETFRLAGILLLGLLLGDLGSTLLPHDDRWATSRLLASLILAWSVVVSIQHRRGRRVRGYFSRSESAPRVTVVLALLAGCSLTLIGLSLLSHLPFDPPQTAQVLSDRLSAGPRWPLLVTSLVLAPVCEELFFRGWLLSAWQPGHRRWTAILAVTIPFTVFHVFSWQMLLALPLGLFFGWLATRYRTLLPAVAAHAGANAAPPLMEPVLRMMGHPTPAIQAMESIPLTVSVLGLLLFVMSLVALSGFRPPGLTPPPPSPR